MNAPTRLVMTAARATAPGSHGWLDRRISSIALPLLFALAGCDKAPSEAAKDAAPPSKPKTEAREAEPGAEDKRDADEATEKDAPVVVDAAAAVDGLDAALDNSGLDETGNAIAKLFDAAKTCSFDMNSQIRGCKPYDEFRAMQKAVSPMTKEFAAQRDRVVRTRLESKEATVRAWSYNLSGGLYRDQPDSRAAIEKAISDESDTVALLVGLRAVRQYLRDHPSLEPVFEKHAQSSVPEVAETARKALDDAAK